MAPAERTRPSERRRESDARRHHKKKRKPPATASTPSSSESRPERTSQRLSVDALAQLNQQNARQTTKQKKTERETAPRPKRARRQEYHEVDRFEYEKPRREHKHKKRRVVSGAIAEEGRSRGLRGGGHAHSNSYDSLQKDEYDYRPKQPWFRRRRTWIWIGCGVVVLIAIIVAVAIVVSKNNSTSSSTTSNLNSISPNSIPAGAPSWLDPFQWADTTDFNLTYTDATVGDLPVMGLPTSWDDSKSANGNTPPLNKAWGSYGDRPARGVNLGGWLSLEPFITPSLFNYPLSQGIIDEWTLCTYLGSSCASTLEKHYSTFVNEQTFADIANAGLDHVRIPFSYWAVQTYPGDAYIFRTSWRYLLRGIEWARKYGLRINLDLHGLPGSQNGWNHSGRQGVIGWLNGTDGQLNAQRSLDVHDKLSKFFAQDRYKNIISHYGLANEPKMTYLSVSDVMAWTTKASSLVRSNGIKDAVIVFGDGFMGLYKWQGQLPGAQNLALDAHQYVIFNANQIVFNHTAKIQYACDGWTKQTLESMNTATGFGPTLVAEWSQADTDCALHLTNVGMGNRWTGTLDTGNASTNVLTPRCPTMDKQCECADPNNSDASKFSDTYKKFLRTFAEAQMHSFEKGWGWFYWTWDTESAPQWSYKKGLAAGILPPKAYQRDFDCSQAIPSFSDMPEYI